MTEAPETFGGLRSQRERWHRGLADVLWRHRRMLLNPRYGAAGMVLLPYYLLVEFLAPIIEALGIIGLIVGLLLGSVNTEFAMLFFLVAYGFGLVLSLCTLVLEGGSYGPYRGAGAYLRMLLWTVLESVGYRQLTVLWRLEGIWKFLRGNNAWKPMERRGFGPSAAALLLGMPVLASPCRAAVADTVPAGVRPFAVEAAVTYERLSRDQSPWREFYAHLEGGLAPRTTLYTTVLRTERFGLRDGELSAGGYLPLGARWTANLEASASAEHRVLPAWSANARLHRVLGAGWGMEVDAGRREYAASSVNSARATLERYWGAFRAAYTVTVSDVEAAGSATAHLVQVNRYGGDDARIGLALAAGHETESLGGGEVLITRVRSAGVSGTLPLSGSWAATLASGIHEQGALYTRSRFQLGIRRRF